MKRSVNLSGMGGKRGRYARSIHGLVDAMRAVGMTDDEIRAEVVKEAVPETPTNVDDVAKSLGVEPQEIQPEVQKLLEDDDTPHS